MRLVRLEMEGFIGACKVHGALLHTSDMSLKMRNKTLAEWHMLISSESIDEICLEAGTVYPWSKKRFKESKGFMESLRVAAVIAAETQSSERVVVIPWHCNITWYLTHGTIKLDW